MGKKGGKKLQAFCVNRIRPFVRVPIQNKLGSPKNYGKKNDQIGDQVDSNDISTKFHNERDNGEEKLKALGRKIMVVVDPSAEAKGALQWVLTHTVQSLDIIILLYVAKLKTKQGNYLHGFFLLFLSKFVLLFIHLDVLVTVSGSTLPCLPVDQIERVKFYEVLFTG